MLPKRASSTNPLEPLTSVFLLSTAIFNVDLGRDYRCVTNIATDVKKTGFEHRDSSACRESITTGMAREASIRLLASFENLRSGWSVLEGGRERRETHSLSAPRATLDGPPHLHPGQQDSGRIGGMECTQLLPQTCRRPPPTADLIWVARVRRSTINQTGRSTTSTLTLVLCTAPASPRGTRTLGRKML
jgi:hypothetical protein